MKFLLFFVSVLFSIIFFIFYSLTQWRGFFWNKISNTYNLSSLSTNLLIESFWFALIWILFLYLFSNFKKKQSYKLQTHKIDFFYFLFYIIFIFYLYFFNKNIDNFKLIIMVLFVFWDMCFNHISNIKSLIKQKIKIRYLWLFINYLVTILAFYNIFVNDVSFIPVIIIIFNIVFNFLVHKKYTNYISLFLSIISVIYLLYNLSFFILDVYL